MIKDYTTIGLAQCCINSWKEYKNFEKALEKRLIERGFKEDGLGDAECFISDNIIGNEIENGEDFEKDVLETLEEQRCSGD